MMYLFDFNPQKVHKGSIPKEEAYRERRKILYQWDISA